MKYQGDPDHKHDDTGCTGVLISNLGTPDMPTPAALRKYLGEFLSDPRIIEVPKFIWWFVLHGIILRTRPRRSARAYQEVWTDSGSPLLYHSIRQVDAVQTRLDKLTDTPFVVEIAMRYGNPSIASGLKKLRQAGANRVLIFPLYPQYSATTTASTFDAVADELKTWRRIPELRMINHYHDHPDYIAALANSIEQHWQESPKPEKLLYSFHGIPRHYFLAGDPYHCECHKTARLVSEKLGLADADWQVTFQSRFGPREWLKPYTDKTLTALAKNGVRHVQVICPGFAVDCLETLEEIKLQNEQNFFRAGGAYFSYIPALNDREDHINALTQIILQHCQGWEDQADDYGKRLNRAKQLGAKQ